METAIDGLSVTQITGQPAQWAVQLPIPPHCLNDGIQTFIIREIGSAITLAHFAIAAGTAIGDDIFAELDLLRAELDLLKRAFRRHCVETAGKA